MWPFRKAVTPTSAKSAAFYYGLSPSRSGLTGAAYNKLAAEGYVECLVAFACINRIAASVASVEPQLYRKGKKGKLQKVDDSPLLDLLERPNPAQSGKEFIRHLTSYHQLAGNAYLWGNGIDAKSRKPKPPAELQLLNPGSMSVEKGRGFFPLQYEYKPDPSNKIIFPVEQVTGRSAILQLKTFHPLNAWYGLPAITPAALSVDIHTGGQQWNKSLIERGARPSGALTVKGEDGKPASLSDEQYGRVKEMIDQQFSGPDNAGRPFLLEGGVEWQEMSLNPKDMEFLDGKHSAARDIALTFGVPPQLLGIPGDSTFSNYSEAKTAFWTDTALPLLALYLEGLNRWLTPLYGDDLFLWYDEEMIPALEPLRKAKADRINSAEYMTINEKRQAMGLDDIDGGDIVFVSAQDIPLDIAGSPDFNAAPSVTNTPNLPPDQVAKRMSWLIEQGYSKDRAERLAKLIYA